MKVQVKILKKANLTKSQLQELVLGEGGLTTFVKTLLDATNALLKFANSGIGKTIINMTLLYAGLTLLGKGFALLSAKGITLTTVMTTLRLAFARFGNTLIESGSLLEAFKRHVKISNTHYTI